MTIRDKGDYWKALLYSYHTTWRVGGRLEVWGCYGFGPLESRFRRVLPRAPEGHYGDLSNMHTMITATITSTSTIPLAFTITMTITIPIMITTTINILDFLGYGSGCAIHDFVS